MMDIFPCYGRGSAPTPHRFPAAGWSKLDIDRLTDDLHGPGRVHSLVVPYSGTALQSVV